MEKWRRSKKIWNTDRPFCLIIHQKQFFAADVSHLPIFVFSLCKLKPRGSSLSVSTRLQRLLLIRDHEWTLVSRLFAFEFFQGISIAVFFYCTITIFLDHLSTENLPNVFVLSAFLLWTFGFLYTRVEHLLPVKNLILAVIFFNAALILLFRFGLTFPQPLWFYYLMLGSYNVAYLLSNLEFWGTAALLFDVRQSKRLFSIVSAGDIPAKLIGYLASAFLGHYLGEANLLWIAFGSTILSIYFFQQLKKTGALDHHHDHNHDHSNGKNPVLLQTAKIFRRNVLVRRAAFISFFSYSAFILLNFIFFGYVKEASHEHGSSLALFIGIFLALSRLITLIIKLTVTNRLADRLGIRNALLITPVILFALCLIALPATFFGSLDVVFYTFAAIAIITDVLRSAIQFPVLLAALQPLPVKERLGGHTVIKGITDPFAFLTVGSMLLVFFILQPELDYRIMTVMLLLLVIGCIISVLSFDKNYVQTLQLAIRNRTVRHREVMITDRESIQILKEKISNGEPGEVMLALHLVKSQPQATQREMLLAALHHSSTVVQCEAVSLVREWNLPGLLPQVKEISLQSNHQDVLVTALSVLASMDPSFDYAGFLIHTNPDIVRAAMVYSLTRNDSSSKEARQLLISRAHSSDHTFRLQAAKTIGELSGNDFHSLIVELLHDSNPHVQEAAIFAAGKQHNELLNHELIRMLDDQNNHPAIIEALRMQGGMVIDMVQTLILTSPDERLWGKMIMLLGKINDDRAKDVLDQLTDELPAMRETIFKAMNHAGFKADHHQKAKYQKFVRDHLNSASHLVYLMQYLESEHAHTALIDAIQLELLSIRDNLLELFSFLYDAGSIKKATAGLKINSNESLATALEIISESVAHEFSKIFISLFEHTSLTHKSHELKGHYAVPHLTRAVACDIILCDQHHHFNAWSKSCVMYFMRDEMRLSGKASIEPLTHSPNPLLKETSQWVLNFMQGISIDSSPLAT